ncbi:MAG TPA: SRPBCC domain-containing protein [Rhodanobacter sp.]|nr:SRPBCC domain-containing protein [Rhodanobacter sp.]
MTPTQSSDADAAALACERNRHDSIVVKRNFHATVDELFCAWLDAESLAQWMHPGTTSPSTATVDARVGGAFEVVMHYPDGPKRHHGEYRVIERNRKLVFTWISDATHHTKTLVTVDFHASLAGTEIVLTHERMPDHEAGLSHERGWTAAFDLLQILLPA